jgi:small multidrug resistance pump
MKLAVAYFFLFSGVVLGSTANSLLKLTEGFTKPLLSMFCSVFIILAIYCLSKAMTVIPAGFTYATYGGLTITAVTLFGMFKYNQVPNVYGIVGLLFIIIGVILVNYFGRISS